MLGRAGSWVGAAAAALAVGRYWFYQDFAAGSGPALVITQNDNGTGGPVFDATKIITNSAVPTNTDGVPIFSATPGTPATEISATNTTSAVTLSGTPHVSYGTVRVWYLYSVLTSGLPTDMQTAPVFVTSKMAQWIDSYFLNQNLNLSDLTSAATALTNLGFNTQTAGQVLFGNGAATFTSEAELFYDASNNWLGVGTSSPTVPVHIFNTSGQAQLSIDSRVTSTQPILNLQAARSANANLALNDVVGDMVFNARFNTSTGIVSKISSIYKGNGTTQTADLVFYNSNAGAVAEVLRITAAGVIDTVLGAGAVQSDAGGLLTSGTLPFASGGTGVTSLAAGAVYSTGTILASETSLTVPRGGTGVATLTNHGLLVGQAAANVVAMAAGTAGQLVTSGGAAADPAWTTATFPATATTGDLLYASASNAWSSLAKTNSAILITNGSGVPSWSIYNTALNLLLPTQTANANKVLTTDGSNTSWAGALLNTQYKAAQNVAMAMGTRSFSVTFATDFGSANYAVFVSIGSTDVNPEYFSLTRVAKTSAGFSFEINENTPSTGYVFDWHIIGLNNP